MGEGCARVRQHPLSTGSRGGGDGLSPWHNDAPDEFCSRFGMRRVTCTRLAQWQPPAQQERQVELLRRRLDVVAALGSYHELVAAPCHARTSSHGRPARSDVPVCPMSAPGETGHATRRKMVRVRPERTSVKLARPSPCYVPSTLTE